jgi:hypothetical protein
MAPEIKEILTTRPGLSNHKAQDQINLNKTGKTDLQIRTRGLIQTKVKILRNRIQTRGLIQIKDRILLIQIVLRQMLENLIKKISRGIQTRIEIEIGIETEIAIDQNKVRKVQEINQKTPKS